MKDPNKGGVRLSWTRLLVADLIHLVGQAVLTQPIFVGKTATFVLSLVALALFYWMCDIRNSAAAVLGRWERAGIADPEFSVSQSLIVLLTWSCAIFGLAACLRTLDMSYGRRWLLYTSILIMVSFAAKAIRHYTQRRRMTQAQAEGRMLQQTVTLENKSTESNNAGFVEPHL